MIPAFARYIIGIGVPFASVLAVPLLNRLAVMPFGMPLGLVWLFVCIPLTSVCLAICWFGFDRHRRDDEFGSGR